MYYLTCAYTDSRQSFYDGGITLRFNNRHCSSKKQSTLYELCLQRRGNKDGMLQEFENIFMTFQNFCRGQLQVEVIMYWNYSIWGTHNLGSPFTKNLHSSFNPLH